MKKQKREKSRFKKSKGDIQQELKTIFKDKNIGKRKKILK